MITNFATFLWQRLRIGSLIQKVQAQCQESTPIPRNPKQCKKNDIILARFGEGTIGKVALIDDDELQGVFADFTMRIRLKD